MVLGWLIFRSCSSGRLIFGSSNDVTQRIYSGPQIVIANAAAQAIRRIETTGIEAMKNQANSANLEAPQESGGSAGATGYVH